MNHWSGPQQMPNKSMGKAVLGLYAQADSDDLVLLTLSQEKTNMNCFFKQIKNKPSKTEKPRQTKEIQGNQINQQMYCNKDKKQKHQKTKNICLLEELKT